jgi:hypothetical protein
VIRTDSTTSSETWLKGLLIVVTAVVERARGCISTEVAEQSQRQERTAEVAPAEVAGAGHVTSELSIATAKSGKK